MDGRDATTGNNLDTWGVLNDLYANEISASIAWIRDRGFHATLGNATLAEKWFHSNGEAARWLRYQAPIDFLQTEFTRALDRVAPRIDAILDDLYTNKISSSISWIWDGGFYATLGAPKQADDWAFARIDDAVEWLTEQAVARYPEASSHANMAASCDSIAHRY
jgi:hypothetical protein